MSNIKISNITLLFSDDFTANEKQVLSETFKSNTESLGIALEGFSVLFHKGDIGRKECFGKMSQIGNRLFSFTLNVTNSIATSIFAVGHEVVHVRQYLYGQLRDDDGGAYWNNKYVPALYCLNPLYYKILPWEVEAHGLQERLYDKALEALFKSTDEATQRAIVFFRKK